MLRNMMYDWIQSFLMLTAVGTSSYHWGLNCFLGLTCLSKLLLVPQLVPLQLLLLIWFSKSSSCHLFNGPEFQHVITRVTYEAHSELLLVFM